MKMGRASLLWSMIFLSSNLPITTAWLFPQLPPTTAVGQLSPLISRQRLAASVIDADFERVEGGDGGDSSRNDIKAKPDLGSKSLLDISLESDADWNVTRIPFLDGENFIDVKLAFMAELDGVQYGIGVPFDHAAAITIERNDQVLNLSPDDPDNEEVIQIMASQLQEHVGKDLTLKKTPRILTIKGPLEVYTRDWKDKLSPESIETKTLLDDGDEDLKFFHDFMRKELGEEEYQKTLQEDPSEIDSDIFDLFDSFAREGPHTAETLFPNGLNGDDDLFIKEMEEFVNKDISHDGVALKLLSYKLPDGNKYSVVHLLKPYALVGKFTENDDDIRFELLSHKDAELLVPRLEEACQKDLQKAGLTGDNIAN